MGKSLSSIIQSYLFTLKLQSKYPDANDYVYLSAVFPEKFKDSDIVLPVKYDSNGSLEEIYEVNGPSGVLSTSILPIEYRSFYAAGISEVIKDIIEENEVFFKVFLKKFKKIVVSVNSKKDNNILVIDNYVKDFTYSLEDLLDVLLRNYGLKSGLRDEVISKIIFSLSNNALDYSSINYRFYLNLIGDKKTDFDCLLQLFLLEKDFESLFLLLTDGCVKSRDNYLKNHAFKIINDILSINRIELAVLREHFNLLSSRKKLIIYNDDIFKIMDLILCKEKYKRIDETNICDRLSNDIEREKYVISCVEALLKLPQIQSEVTSMCADISDESNAHVDYVSVRPNVGRFEFIKNIFVG